MIESTRSRHHGQSSGAHSGQRPAPARRFRSAAAWVRALTLGMPGFWMVLLLGTSWTTSGADRAEQARVLEVRGTVEFLQAGSSTWYLVATNQRLYQGDSLRTGPRSAASLMLTNRTIAPVPALTTLKFKEQPGNLAIEVLKGLLYLFHRGGERDFEVTGGGVTAAVRGTEFAFERLDDGSVRTTLFEGRVDLTDSTGGRLELAAGDVAIAPPGSRAARTATVPLGDWTAVQWALNYPVILDAKELGWTPGSGPDPEIAASWSAFGAGDLPRALASYPEGRVPRSDPERVFLAALLISVGSVAEAEALLLAVTEQGAPLDLAAAHRRLIEWVRRGVEPLEGWPLESGSTALLAESYVLQGAARLVDARDAARRAVERSPEFGWAWIRLAEMEFTLEDRRAAEAALERGLDLLPGNAGGLALKGFLLAARNRVAEAEAVFESALETDGRLGTAWLGRGLTRIRRGSAVSGREDLLVAAAIEPQRSLYRSYLGKALGSPSGFAVPALEEQARNELSLAARLDPGDPTPWLYSALLNQQENRLNDAIEDLGRSMDRNENRAIHRSRRGLDQDRAVRGANLANVFADVGFQDLGIREATRAVNADYGNAAAHLFLANSYDALRDPRQINLRYETPWFSEFLLANLLAPVGAGSLSQTVAQNEYSRLFERDRLGIVNRTTWTGNGDWLEQAAQFGQLGNLAYALEGFYRSERGQRLNNEYDERSLSFTAKVQAGPADSLFLRATISETEAGDVLQRYDPASAIPGLRLEEQQEPVAQVGWNHEWRPGVHTLVLVSPWNANQSLVNPSNSVPWVLRNASGDVELGQASVVPLDSYDSRLTGVSAEIQQLWSLDRHGVIAGLRYQHGGFDTTARLDVDDFAADAPTDSAVDEALERVSVYAYDQWLVARGVLVSAGVSYDRLTQPRNFRTAPLSPGDETMERWLPKVGVTVTPWKGGTLRTAWARSLGGVSFDQSVRLEPVQVAGFTQVARGVIPESVMGSVAGQDMDILGLAWDQVLATRTWLTLSAERITSDASRGIGGFLYGQGGFEGTTAFRQDLDFEERSVALVVGQLVGRDLAFTLRYRLAEAELSTESPGLPAEAGASRDERSVLGQLTLGARYQLPVGFFGSWESTWTDQSNHGDAAWMAGDSFWRHDVWVGWRFLQRRAEVSVGVLNLTDEDYRLYPLNYYGETYRERTVAVTGRFAF
ncbi:MAG: FecR domain-containing protein [Limisphaerales bacterium]